MMTKISFLHRSVVPAALALCCMIGCDQEEEFDEFDVDNGDFVVDSTIDPQVSTPHDDEELGENTASPVSNIPDSIGLDPGDPRLSGANKACSIFVHGHWRDTMVVPNGWTWHDCHSLRVSMGANSYQLGCLTESGYSFSGVNAISWPAPC